MSRTTIRVVVEGVPALSFGQETEVLHYTGDWFLDRGAGRSVPALRSRRTPASGLRPPNPFYAPSETETLSMCQLYGRFQTLKMASPFWTRLFVPAVRLRL